MNPPPVEILYEEGPCLVVLKPNGLLTQAPAGIDSMEVRLKTFLKKRDGKTGNIYLGVPHRLDRPVSGAMTFARHVRASRRISDQFATRTVTKTYWACVSGRVEPAEGTWEDHIRKVPNQARAEIVTAESGDGKPAVLHYRTLGETPHGSWLSITLETGRMHQIRVQAASRGHAILGDAMYGSEIPFGEQFEDTRHRAIALHARELGFRHPMNQEPVDVEAPLPENWASLDVDFEQVAAG